MMRAQTKAAEAGTLAAESVYNNNERPDITFFPDDAQSRETALRRLGGYYPTSRAPKTRNSHDPVRANGMFRGKPHPVLRGDRNQCPTCAELFNSTRVFEMHRAGTYEPDARRCLSVAELRARGFTCPDGFWRAPISDADRARLTRLWNH